MEAARKKRRELPDWFIKKPDLPEGAGFYLASFRDLTTCRYPDGPIPWTAVTLYADKLGLDSDVAGLLWAVIRAMDVAERRWYLDQSTPSEPKPED